MNKIDEFVEEYGEGFERLSSDDFTWRDNKKQCRADFHAAVESLLPSDESLEAEYPTDTKEVAKQLKIPERLTSDAWDVLVRISGRNKEIQLAITRYRSRILAAIDAKDIPDKTENIKSFKTGCNAGKYGFLCSLQPGGLHCQTCDYCVDAKDDAKKLKTNRDESD